MMRHYAQALGLALFGLGVLGVFMGEEPLFGLLNIDLAEDVVHVVTGCAMTAVAFTPRTNHVLRSVTGVTGAMYVTVGVLGFFMPHLFGLLPHGYSLFDNVVHLLLGLLGIGVTWVLPRKEAPAAHPGLA